MGHSDGVNADNCRLLAGKHLSTGSEIQEHHRSRRGLTRRYLWKRNSHKVRTLLYQWAKKNSVILVNAGSLVGTTAVTSVLGFAYWWLAARRFSPEALGLASPPLPALLLLGCLRLLGLSH